MSEAASTGPATTDPLASTNETLVKSWASPVPVTVTSNTISATETASPLASISNPPRTWLATFSAIFWASTVVDFEAVNEPFETVTTALSYQGVPVVNWEESSEADAVDSPEGVIPYP